jgi:hypothetical protein
MIGILSFKDMYQKAGEKPWFNKIDTPVGMLTFALINHLSTEAGLTPYEPG